jgi:hypothetical protein
MVSLQKSHKIWEGTEIFMRHQSVRVLEKLMFRQSRDRMHALRHGKIARSR